MLDYWEIHATKLIVQSMEQQNASLEKLLQISFNRDKKMEIGIYTWAKYDPVVAARLVDMEEQRISCVAKLYQKIGIDENESIDRARLAYLTYVGWMTRFEANPNFDIDKMVDLLINDNKCP